jgi:predicted ABC-class ATPase
MNSTVITQKLEAIDNKDYGAYQALKETYQFGYYNLTMEQIPKDPYAPPHTGIYRIVVDRKNPDVVSADLQSKIRQIAFRDYLSRLFFASCQQYCKGRRGTGYSGIITINEPGQAILERSSVLVNENQIELRCFIGLPATGRLIDAQIAKQMLLQELPLIIDHTLLKRNLKDENLTAHLDIAEDTELLRQQLNEHGLVAFICNQAILPRKSGSSNQPLDPDSAVPFISPKEYQVEFTLPHSGKITGMGVPSGVTLITGGGYHGKSTLLDAISLGIYNHIPGDGREYCVSHPDSVKIRAYTGRYITNTNISSFISNLPFSKDTIRFSTDNASGSTSQAAGIMEALEVGARVLLMDEDTCAINFMIRDQKMQQLVRKADEPITTFIDKVRDLYSNHGVSTILVLGGIGDYFEVADHVIQMNNYQAIEVTQQAKKIVESSPIKRTVESSGQTLNITDRIPLAQSINPENLYGKIGIYAKETYRIHFGQQEIDLTDLEQLVELSQTRALGFAINYAKIYMNGTETLKQVVDKIINDIEECGIDIIDKKISPNFACFRSHELAFVLNRMRGFKASKEDG